MNSADIDQDDQSEDESEDESYSYSADNDQDDQSEDESEDESFSKGLNFKSETEAFYGISVNGHEMFPFDQGSMDGEYTDDEDIGKAINDDNGEEVSMKEDPPARRLQANCINRKVTTWITSRLPHNHEEAMLIDDENEDTQWKDAEVFEFNQLMEHKVFRDLGLDALALVKHQKSPYMWIYSIKPDGRCKARLVKTVAIIDSPSDEDSNSDDDHVYGKEKWKELKAKHNHWSEESIWRDSKAKHDLWLEQLNWHEWNPTLLHESEPYDGYDSDLGDQRIFDARLHRNHQTQLAEQLAARVPPEEVNNNESGDDEPPPLLNRDRVRYESSDDEDSDGEPPPLINRPYDESSSDDDSDSDGEPPPLINRPYDESSSDEDSDGEYVKGQRTDFQQGDW